MSHTRLFSVNDVASLLLATLNLCTLSLDIAGPHPEHQDRRTLHFALLSLVHLVNLCLMGESIFTNELLLLPYTCRLTKLSLLERDSLADVEFSSFCTFLSFFSSTLKSLVWLTEGSIGAADDIKALSLTALVNLGLITDHGPGILERLTTRLFKDSKLGIVPSSTAKTGANS